MAVLETTRREDYHHEWFTVWREVGKFDEAYIPGNPPDVFAISA